MDHPLAYAVNSFQAFTVCLHVIYKYTSWRAYESNEPYYRWSPKIMPDAETTILEFLEHHIEAVCKPQVRTVSIFLLISNFTRGTSWLLSQDTSMNVS